jgi:hypothetical protein
VFLETVRQPRNTVPLCSYCPRTAYFSPAGKELSVYIAGPDNHMVLFRGYNLDVSIWNN